MLACRGNKDGIVKEDLVSEIVRKALLQIFHDLAGMARHIDRVCAWRLVDADGREKCTVKPAIAIFGFGTEIDAGDVSYAHYRPIAIGAHDDVFELVGLGQPALGLDRQLKLLVLFGRRGANAATSGRRKGTTGYTVAGRYGR